MSQPIEDREQEKSVTTEAETAAIAKLATQYFDALYHGDVELFRKIFHPDARLYCSNDQYLTMDVDAYMDLVANRESPASRKDKRSEEILSISMSTPTTAHLRVRETFIPKHFTDELLLLNVNGDWKIVAKTWDFVLLKA
jgi:hypothetical protein